MNNNGKIKAAEFRGRVLTELQHIKSDTKDIKKSVNGNAKNITDNTKRIYALRNRWAWATGIASGVGAVAGFIANILFS